MDKDGDSPPPFWFQPPMAPPRSHRRSTSPIINPVILIILLPILAILIIFFFLLPFLSHASSIFRPNSVKKSWDSINIFLVLFAILCGFLARRNDDASPADAGDVNDGVADVSFDDKMNSSVTNRWFEDSDRKFFSSPVRVPGNGVGRLRSSSSYPDLRQESLWEIGGNRYRFYDDFDVNLNLNRSADSDSPHHRPRRSEIGQVDRFESDVKVIPVDTFVRHSSPPRNSPSPSPLPAPPPPPPPPPENLVRKRTYRSVPKRERVQKRIEKVEKETEFVQSQSPPPPPPPPPPPSAEAIPRHRQKHEKSDRKKSSATKDIATTIASLYNQSKRKRKHKTRNIYDNATHSPPTDSMPPPAPPPPPPPPPPSVFQNMFRKGTKSKRIHSLSSSVPPPPPPPPPPSSIFNNLFKNSSKSKRFSATAIDSDSSAPPPPPPPPPSSMLNALFKTGNKSRRFHSTSGSQPTPPQPPPVPPAPVTSTRKSKRSSHIQPAPESHPQPEPPRLRTVPSGKPPLPTRASSYYESEELQEYLNSGSQSPLIPVAPPPPPFKMPAMKYVFRGDFVKISSNNSSRCSSPEREDVANSAANQSDGGASMGSGFCPSPDVNIKAATFIARLRDEWKLEKMNSVKEKQ